MLYGGGHDARDVGVDERIHRFASLAFDIDELGGPEHLEVLGDQVLAHLEVVDEFVDILGLLGQGGDDGQAGRRGKQLSSSPAAS